MSPHAVPAPRPRRVARLSTAKKAAFAALTLVAIVGGAEVVLRVREVVRAGRRTTLSPRAPDAYRGMVLVPGRFEREGQVVNVSALGTRGPEVAAEKAPGTTRVVCVGGSTTYGLYTSRDEHTWPARVEARLREAGRAVEVVNAGAPAWDLRTSQTDLELRMYPLRPDVVVCMQGYNDLVANLDPAYRRDSTVEDVRALWRPLRLSALYRFLAGRIQDPRAALEHKADRLDGEGLAAFERNLRRLVRRTREEGGRVLLCTHPSAFRPTEAESRAAGVPGLDRWFGELSPFTYGALLDGLARYNEVIRAVARDTSSPLADVAARLPQDVTLYETPIHHSDRGEDGVAAIVAEALVSSGLVPPPEPRRP